MIRYKIDSAMSRFKLSLTRDHKEKRELKFEHGKYIYFVDILENNGDGVVKVNILFPDGDIACGWINLDWIQLHFIGDVFDGRFNYRS